MKIIKLLINTNSQKYQILIGFNLISNLSKLINRNSLKFKKCLFIIDKNVPKTQINKIKKNFKNKEIYFHFFNATEKNKNQQHHTTVVKRLQIDAKAC